MQFLCGEYLFCTILSLYLFFEYFHDCFLWNFLLSLFQIRKGTFMRSHAYYQNNFSLVFQFIVSKYLTICQLFKILEEEVQRRNYEGLRLTFTKLIGPFENSCFKYSIYFDDGLLSKFQNSCLHLPNEQFKGPLSIQRLSNYVQKVFKLSCQTWNSIENMDASSDMAFFFSEPLEKIQKYLRKIGQLLSRLFLQFDTDEKVLLYLLQNHEFISTVYPNRFVINLLSQMFPNGISEAEEFIARQYTRRGYHQLIPLISEASQKLQSKINP